jgi:protein TonB
MPGPLSAGPAASDFPPPAPGTHRINVPGGLQAAKLIDSPPPVYPDMARNIRLQGVVKLHVLVDKDGKISGMRVISGHPLLVPPAMEAVKQWRYSTTLLNGEPVEVVSQADVNFMLPQ